MSLPSHILNCCVLIAGGLVYLVAAFILDFSAYPGNEMHLAFVGMAGLLVSIGCVGLVCYLARSLPCAIVYMTGIYTTILAGALVMTCGVIQAVETNDMRATAVFLSLLTFLLAFTMRGCYKEEREFIGELLEERREVRAQQEDVTLLQQQDESSINYTKV